eukprot:474346-Rhodomonas_salina.1
MGNPAEEVLRGRRTPRDGALTRHRRRLHLPTVQVVSNTHQTDHRSVLALRAGKARDSPTPCRASW